MDWKYERRWWNSIVNRWRCGYRLEAFLDFAGHIAFHHIGKP